MLAFTFIPSLPDPNPLQYTEFTMHLTEVCVLISLMGAGLALDRPLGLAPVVDHLADAGPCDAALHRRADPAGLGVLGLGLGRRAARGRAPSRPPTRCSPPKSRWASRPMKRTKRRAARTRSGSASPPRPASTMDSPFPLFTWPSPSASSERRRAEWFVHWFTVDLLWRIGAGVLLGWLAGKALAGSSSRPGMKRSGCPPTPKGSWRWRPPSWPTVRRKWSTAMASSPSSSAP